MTYTKGLLYASFLIDGETIVAASGWPHSEVQRCVGMDPLDLTVPLYHAVLWRSMYWASTTGKRQTILTRRHGVPSCLATVSRRLDGRLRLKILCTVQASFPLGGADESEADCVPAAMRSAR